MSYNKVTIEDKNGNKYYPITNLENISNIEEVAKYVDINNVKINSSNNEKLGDTLINIKNELKDHKHSANEIRETESKKFVTSSQLNEINNIEDKATKTYVNNKIKDINQFDAINKNNYSFNSLKDAGVYRVYNSNTSPCGTLTDYIVTVYKYNNNIIQVARSSIYKTSDHGNKIYTRSYYNSTWSDWRELTNTSIEKEINNLKKFGVESNRVLVDALNSKGIVASTNDTIKTNIKKVESIKVEHNWSLKNLNPDPLFKEKQIGWESNQNTNITFNDNVAIINFRQTTSTPGIKRKNHDIKLVSGKTYRISFYVKHTNKINNTRAYFFDKADKHTIECGALNTYVQGDNFTRYTTTFKPTKTDDYKLMILSSGPRNIGDIMYVKEVMISEGYTDNLFIPNIVDNINQLYDDKSGSPGSPTLLKGTMDEGYFGIVPASELIKGDELSKKVSFTKGEYMGEDMFWFKFAFKNKVIFRSSKPIRHSVSWDDLNSASLVYGGRIILINGVKYRIRLMKGAKTDPSDHNSKDKGAIGSEFNRLILPAHYYNLKNDWDRPDFVDKNLQDWGTYFKDTIFGTIPGEKGRAIWYQETISQNNNYKVRRGGGGITSSGSALKNDKSEANGWCPILEVV